MRNQLLLRVRLYVFTHSCWTSFVRCHFIKVICSRALENVLAFMVFVVCLGLIGSNCHGQRYWDDWYLFTLYFKHVRSMAVLQFYIFPSFSLSASIIVCKLVENIPHRYIQWNNKCAWNVIMHISIILAHHYSNIIVLVSVSNRLRSQCPQFYLNVRWKLFRI